MPNQTHPVAECRLYVLKEHREQVKEAIGHRAFKVQFPEALGVQNLVPVKIVTIPMLVPEIIQILADRGIPYDIHRTNGGSGYGRFDEYGKFHISANVKGRPSVNRDWDNQAEYRKRWATLKLIDLIEDKPCPSPATTTPSPTKRNPILRGKSSFYQSIPMQYEPLLSNARLRQMQTSSVSVPTTGKIPSP